jgi:hypothetical protein
VTITDLLKGVSSRCSLAGQIVAANMHSQESNTNINIGLVTLAAACYNSRLAHLSIEIDLLHILVQRSRILLTTRGKARVASNLPQHVELTLAMLLCPKYQHGLISERR